MHIFGTATTPGTRQPTNGSIPVVAKKSLFVC